MEKVNAIRVPLRELALVDISPFYHGDDAPEKGMNDWTIPPEFDAIALAYSLDDESHALVWLKDNAAHFMLAGHGVEIVCDGHSDEHIGGIFGDHTSGVVEVLISPDTDYVIVERTQKFNEAFLEANAQTL